MAAIATLAILAGAWLAYGYRSSHREEVRIRARYEQMRHALASRDTNTFLSFFTAHFRGRAQRRLDLFQAFAKPLGRQSSVRISTDRALVCPERIVRYRVLSGGHTLEMVKLDGEWFFTGQVHID